MINENGQHDEEMRVGHLASRLYWRDPCTQKQAATALGLTGAEEAVQPLLDILDDSLYNTSPDVLCAAVEALATFGLDDRIVFEISTLLTHRDARVKKCVGDVLAGFTIEELVRRLLTFYRNGNHERDEYSFGRIILALNRDEVVSTLTQMLERGTASERSLAAWVLTWFTEPDVVPLLIRVLHDDWFHPITQRRAAETLGCTRGLRPLVALFVSMMRTRDAVLRWHAFDALAWRLITGRGQANRYPLHRLNQFPGTRGRWDISP